MIHGGGLIEGTVRDTDGNPVVGARVRLHSQSAWDWGEQRDKTLAGSDATGLFAFRGVSEGRYNLYVDAKGYSTAWQGNIQIIGSSERTGIEVTLHKGEELKGIVLNKDDGEPVPGVLVTVRSKGAQGKGVTGPEGNFTITSIPEGPYYVTTKLEGFATFSKRRMNAEADGMLHVEISKQPYIKGVVIDDKTEKPIRRFQVMLTRKNERRPGNRWSAASRWISVMRVWGKAIVKLVVRWNNGKDRQLR